MDSYSPKNLDRLERRTYRKSPVRQDGYDFEFLLVSKSILHAAPRRNKPPVSMTMLLAKAEKQWGSVALATISSQLSRKDTRHVKGVLRILDVAAEQKNTKSLAKLLGFTEQTQDNDALTNSPSKALQSMEKSLRYSSICKTMKYERCISSINWVGCIELPNISVWDLAWQIQALKNLLDLIESTLFIQPEISRERGNYAIEALEKVFPKAEQTELNFLSRKKQKHRQRSCTVRIRNRSSIDSSSSDTIAVRSTVNVAVEERGVICLKPIQPNLLFSKPKILHLRRVKPKKTRTYLNTTRTRCVKQPSKLL